MLTISTTKFCTLFDINKNIINSSLLNLIDAFSDSESDVLHGKLIAKFGRLTKQHRTAKESIYGYITFIENCFIKLESDIFLLTFHYAGIDWDDPTAVNWWWTDNHHEIFKNIINQKVNFDKQNFQFLDLITELPDHSYKKQIQELLKKCAEKIVFNRDIEISYDILKFYFNLNKIYNNDVFLNSIISQILSVNNQSKPNFKLDIVFPHVSNLMIAIANADRASIQEILKELNLEHLPPKSIERSTPSIPVKIHEWVDPSWWREQE